jgi:hypothetical protein
VKRILGTAEDYRRLYGEAGGRPRPVAAGTNGAAAKPAAKKPVAKPAARKKKG